MSATFVAGQKLRAADMVPQKLWTVTSTSGTTPQLNTETVILSAPSSTYRSGRAYLLSFRGVRRCNSVANRCVFRVRDTNASGTVRMDTGFYEIPATGTNFMTHFEHVVANTGGADIVGRTLVLTFAGNSGTAGQTVLINAGAAIPYYWSAMEIGAAADFPEAVAL